MTSLHGSSVCVGDLSFVAYPTAASPNIAVKCGSQDSWQHIILSSAEEVVRLFREIEAVARRENAGELLEVLLRERGINFSPQKQREVGGSQGGFALAHLVVPPTAIDFTSDQLKTLRDLQGGQAVEAPQLQALTSAVAKFLDLPEGVEVEINGADLPMQQLENKGIEANADSLADPTAHQVSARIYSTLPNSSEINLPVLVPLGGEKFGYRIGSVVVTTLRATRNLIKEFFSATKAIVQSSARHGLVVQPAPIAWRFVNTNFVDITLHLDRARGDDEAFMSATLISCKDAAHIHSKWNLQIPVSKLSSADIDGELHRISKLAAKLNLNQGSSATFQFVFDPRDSFPDNPIGLDGVIAVSSKNTSQTAFNLGIPVDFSFGPRTSAPNASHVAFATILGRQYELSFLINFLDKIQRDIQKVVNSNPNFSRLTSAVNERGQMLVLAIDNKNSPIAGLCIDIGNASTHQAEFTSCTEPSSSDLLYTQKTESGWKLSVMEEPDSVEFTPLLNGVRSVFI